MKAVRVENLKDGCGCFSSYTDKDEYRSYINLDFLRKLCLKHSTFNDPRNDNLNLNKDKKVWFCAYKDVEQLTSWLSKSDIKRLIKQGFRIYLLEVDEYQVGNHQIIYTKESILTKTDITKELLK